LFKIICSNRSFVLFATIVLSGVLLDNTISSANSILNASSSSSSVYSMSTTTAATPLKPLTHTGVKNAKGNSTFTISYKLKKEINSHIDNGSNAAIVIGLVDPNGTQFYGYGKMSNANQTTVDKNTVFGIGSITKSFTTLLLTDIANRGIVNLNDPIKKYLPSTVKVPTYNGVEITLEDLATHTSGLPHDPPNMPLNGPGFQKFRSNYTKKWCTEESSCLTNWFWAI